MHRALSPIALLLPLAWIAVSESTAASSPVATVAARGCATLAERVDRVPGADPVFLHSYDSLQGIGMAAEPALTTAAFTYDNALAAIALTACGKADQARRIGDALLAAATDDRAGSEGRLRNTYRAGAQKMRPVPPNGWWDARRNQWLEDAYQVGTSTGNVAWAGLALLTLAEGTGEERYRQGAARLARWVVENTADPRPPGGFNGGVHGFEAEPQPLTWKATEHNTDLAALFAWLARDGNRDDADWPARAREARRFLDALWEEEKGYFLTGTLPDGITPNRSTSGLDAQLWPLLLPEAPDTWRRALDYAEQAHGVAGGFDFNDDRDGLWVEGTAQAALVYRLLGRTDEAGRLLGEIAKQVSPGGYLWATREEKITTGLAIGPASVTDDFLYYRQPHLGATAWAVLAATGWNPFTGRRLP
jgi:hypothetical protein